MFTKSKKFLPYNNKLNGRARELRDNMTLAEKKLWYEFLRNHEYIFLRQKPIDNYIVDFFCPKLKLVIEIDGETHITEEDKKYDEKRTRILEKYGLKILRFWNDDVLNGVDIIGEIIDNEIRKMK
jgi:very-short-patch-repair endonuclease